MSGRPGSNRRQQRWQRCTLPTELRPHLPSVYSIKFFGYVKLFLYVRILRRKMAPSRLNNINGNVTASKGLIIPLLPRLAKKNWARKNKRLTTKHIPIPTNILRDSPIRTRGIPINNSINRESGKENLLYSWT